MAVARLLLLNLALVGSVAGIGAALPVEDLGDGLTLTMLEPGDAVTFPRAGDTLVVHYTGMLKDGTVFDSSRDRNEPFTLTIGVGDVIKGWDVGMLALSLGERASLHVPSQLAYGGKGVGDVIPPAADLDFDVELLQITTTSPTTTTTSPATEDSEFIYGVVATNECPAGSARIDTELGCQEAAIAMALDWMDKEVTSRYPKGCYVVGGEGEGGKVYFNEDEGAGDIETRPICGKPPVEDLGNGLRLTVLEKGDGQTFPSNGDRLVMHYTGTLSDGSVFDSSRDRGEPFEFTVGVGEVIEGWDFGVPKMSLGERAVLHVPAAMGYGDAGAAGVIPPGADLDFDVQLLQINDEIMPSTVESETTSWAPIKPTETSSTTSAPASMAASFVYGAAGDTACPTGSELIDSQSDCQRAAAATGGNFVDLENVAWYPRGCYTVGDERDVYLNQHNKGGSDKAAKPLCKRAPTEYLGDGLTLTVLEKGDDATFPDKGDRLSMHYTGTLTASGAVFDSSRARGQPFSFVVGVGDVIEGWDLAVPRMSLGERAVIHVPEDLGYGDDGAFGIPPGADLDFDVQLLRIGDKSFPAKPTTVQTSIPTPLQTTTPTTSHPSNDVVTTTAAAEPSSSATTASTGTNSSTASNSSNATGGIDQEPELPTSNVAGHSWWKWILVALVCCACGPWVFRRITGQGKVPRPLLTGEAEMMSPRPNQNAFAP